MRDWKKDRANESPYSKKLRDPRWQKMRLEVMQRDEFACQHCSDGTSTLNVHHKEYERGRDPWDYPMEWLVTLCESCHEAETFERAAAEAGLLRALRIAGLPVSGLDYWRKVIETLPGGWSEPLEYHIAQAIKAAGLPIFDGVEAMAKAEREAEKR